MTGNTTLQSYLAFFYATGYADVVPTDQTKALLYYTFAAKGVDKVPNIVTGVAPARWRTVLAL